MQKFELILCLVCLFLGGEAPGSSIQLERIGKEGEGAGLVAFNPDVASSIARQRQRLPVYKVCVQFKIIQQPPNESE